MSAGRLYDRMEDTAKGTVKYVLPQSFVGGTIPKGIEHLEYNVDLSLLDGTVIELNC